MHSKEKVLLTALGTAFVLVSVAVFTLVLTTSLLARAGMPFMAAYAVSVAAAIIGTLAVSYGGRTLIALPSPAITAWLVYEEIIAHGVSWQGVLGITALTSCVGVILLRTRYAAALTHALPSIIRTGLSFGLGLNMLMTAALYARILLPSPWALTMGGTLGDPLTYFTLMGILLVLLLCMRNVRTALPLGMGMIGILTWAEGFWEIPAAPFFQPDIGTLVCAATLPQTEVPAAMLLGLTLLCALTVESAAVLAVRIRATEKRRGLTRLLATDAGAAFIGAFPLTISPISAVLPRAEKEHHIAGIPQTAALFALLLLLLLPCAPLLSAMADFPAVPAIALSVLGLLLVSRALSMLRHSADTGLREAAVLSVFLLAAHDIQTGLTLALLVWTLLTAARRERIAPATWGLTTLLSLFFLLKWI